MRLSLIITITTCLLLSQACKSEVTLEDPSCPNCTPQVADYSAALTREIDILFVVDNSLSMLPLQAKLRTQFTHLIESIRTLRGGIPNLHIGVTATSFPTLPYTVPMCEEGRDNDGGTLHRGVATDACANPVNQAYIIDVAAAGCDIDRDDESGVCASHSCAAENCSPESFSRAGRAPEPPGLTLHIDDSGCPRCRNYEGESLSEVFGCMSEFSGDGCGFEQPLRAAEMVTRTQLSANDSAGFIRQSAFLALFFITDEDDCSAKDAELFNPDNETLGPLTSFRCTQYGVGCDTPFSGPGTYENCSPLTTDSSQLMLTPVKEFLDAMSELKGMERVIAMGVFGPFDGALSLGLDAMGYLANLPGCSSDLVEPHPSVRLTSFVHAFSSSEELKGSSISSICEDSFISPLSTLGARIIDFTDPVCPASPLSGCPDPPAAFLGHDFSITQLPESIATICTPTCEVSWLQGDLEPTPIERCPLNYKNGQPPPHDPDLPLPRCWFITYSVACDLGAHHLPSRGARLRFSSREEPTIQDHYHTNCHGFRAEELFCEDGLDNNKNGLTDLEDPDCSDK